MEKRGVVRAIAQLGDDYYVKRGRPRGFDYELVKQFADKHSLRLDILVARDREEAAEWLAGGVGDIAMSPIEEDSAGDTRSFELSRAYRHEIGVVVTPSTQPVKSLAALQGRRVAVVSGSPHQRVLQVGSLGSTPAAVIATASTAESLALMRDSGVDAVVVDADELNSVIAEHHELRAGISLPVEQRYRWTVRADDQQMALAVDGFLQSEYRRETYNVLARRYRTTSSRDAAPTDSISPFDGLLRTYADIYGFDWRLIAAQMYQESRFNPRAVSDAGARGLMQIMPTTASDLGLADPEQPEASIRAGVKYLDTLRSRFDASVPEAERLWLALAAYNTGYERVKRAREYARELGLNPNRWFDHVEVAMRRMTRAESPDRRCRCGQAIVYVRSIRSLYSAYRHLNPV